MVAKKIKITIPENANDEWFKEDWRHIRKSMLLFLLTYIFIGIASLVTLYFAVEKLKADSDEMKARLYRIENILMNQSK
jgi:hypothetical protein